MSQPADKIISELTPRAESGDAAAQFLLGELYRTGMRGCEVNPSLARKWLSIPDDPAQGTLDYWRAASLSNDTDLRLRSIDELGFSPIAYYDPGDLDYVETIRLKAESGDADAQLELGSIYNAGLMGCIPDLNLAEHWFKSAFLGGNELAYKALEKLRGGHRLDQAFREATEKLNPVALDHAYFCFDEESSPFCFKDLLLKALELSELSNSSTFHSAIQVIADENHLRALKEASESFFDFATKRCIWACLDASVFKRYLEHLSSADSPDAYFYLGVLCERCGLFVRHVFHDEVLRGALLDACEDAKVLFYRYAASNGCTKAMRALCKQNAIPISERNTWLVSGAEGGDNVCRVDLAELYWQGNDERGIPKDIERYFNLLHAAAEDGDLSAMVLLAHHYDYGASYLDPNIYEGRRDSSKAFYWYRELLRRGGPVDLMRFGYLCVQRDYRDLPLAFECWITAFLSNPRSWRDDDCWNGTLSENYRDSETYNWHFCKPYVVQIIEAWGSSCAELCLRALCCMTGFGIGPDMFQAFVLFKLTVLKSKDCEESRRDLGTWSGKDCALRNLARLEQFLTEEEIARGCSQAELLSHLTAGIHSESSRAFKSMLFLSVGAPSCDESWPGFLFSPIKPATPLKCEFFPDKERRFIFRVWIERSADIPFETFILKITKAESFGRKLTTFTVQVSRESLVSGVFLNSHDNGGIDPNGCECRPGDTYVIEIPSFGPLVIDVPGTSSGVNSSPCH